MPNILTTILIDDEQEALDLLQMHLLNFPEVEIKGKFSSPQEGFLNIMKHNPDVVFLDIEMPNYNGIDLLGCLKNMKKMPVIVFVTGYDKYLPLIKTNDTVQVLLKPVDPIKLKHTLENITDNILQHKDLEEISSTITTIKQYNKLAVNTQSGAVFIKYSDIVYLEADGNYTNIYTQDGLRINSSFNLKRFQEKLEPGKFLRCHNSIIINTDYLTRVDKRAKTCTLSANKSIELPVSRAGMLLFDSLI